MATISAWAVGSLVRVTWLAPVAMTIPSLTTRAANGPPSKRTFSMAMSITCCSRELLIGFSLCHKDAGRVEGRLAGCDLVGRAVEDGW